GGVIPVQGHWMYIILPPPMSTCLANDSARAVVASEQASVITASNFTMMCFMVVRLSPPIHLLDVRQIHKSHPPIFYWARRRKFDANQLREPSILTVRCPLWVRSRHLR